MTGAEHYAEAEKLLIEVNKQGLDEWRDEWLQRAQIHAILSVTSALLNAATMPEYPEWDKL